MWSGPDPETPSASGNWGPGRNFVSSSARANPEDDDGPAPVVGPSHLLGGGPSVDGASLSAFRAAWAADPPKGPNRAPSPRQAEGPASRGKIFFPRIISGACGINCRFAAPSQATPPLFFSLEVGSPPVHLLPGRRFVPGPSSLFRRAVTPGPFVVARPPSRLRSLLDASAGAGLPPGEAASLLGPGSLSRTGAGPSAPSPGPVFRPYRPQKGLPAPGRFNLGTRPSRAGPGVGSGASGFFLLASRCFKGAFAPLFVVDEAPPRSLFPPPRSPSAPRASSSKTWPVSFAPSPSPGAAPPRVPMRPRLPRSRRGLPSLNPSLRCCAQNGRGSALGRRRKTPLEKSVWLGPGGVFGFGISRPV